MTKTIVKALLQSGRTARLPLLATIYLQNHVFKGQSEQNFYGRFSDLTWSAPKARCSVAPTARQLQIIKKKVATMKPAKRTFLIALVLFCCVGCDQVTKSIALRSLANSGPIIYFHNIIHLQFVENPGAFLSLGASSPENMRFWIFTIISGVFLLGLLVYLLLSPKNSTVKILSLSLVVGGGAGNLIDRIFNEGRVIDFINIGIGSLRTGVFNVADIALLSGIVWFFAITFNDSKKKLPL